MPLSGGNSAGTSLVKVDVPNIAANSNILTASTSVDIATHITFTQTTASITATLLNPTITTVNRNIVLQNLSASTQPITISCVGGDSFTIGVGQSIEIAWNGTSWRLLNPAQVLPEFGENNGIVNNQTITALADITGSAFTLPSAGKWRVFVTMNGQSNLLAGDMTVQLYTSADVLVDSTSQLRLLSSVANNAVNGSMTIDVTTTGLASFKLKGVAGTGTFLIRNVNGASAANSKIAWEKISGFSPVTGQSVDYSGVTQYSANNSTNITTVVSNNSNNFGTLLTTANRINLTGATIKGSMVVTPANGTVTVAKTGSYNIIVSVTIQSAGANGQWGQLVLNNATILTLNSSYSQVSSASMQICFNYSGDFVTGDLIDVRLSASSAGTIGVMGYSYSVQQLGTSATITTPISIFQLDNTGATAQAGTTAAAGIGTGILWGTAMFTKGSKISFTANNGTVTLAGGINGTTYRLTGKANSTGSAGNAYIFYRFYNVTTTLQIGSEGYTVDPDNGASGSGWDETSSPMAYAYITVPANTTQQIRLVVTASSGTPGTIRQQSGQTSCTIEEIEG